MPDTYIGNRCGAGGRDAPKVTKVPKVMGEETPLLELCYL